MTSQQAGIGVIGLTVAIAVEELGSAVERIRSAYGLGEPEYATSTADHVDVATFDIGGSALQLIAPTSPKSLIAKYLETDGPGLHHFGLLVDSVDRVLERIRAQGLRTIDERGRAGAGELTVGFVHPKTTFGSIVELIEQDGTTR